MNDFYLSVHSQLQKLNLTDEQAVLSESVGERIRFATLLVQQLKRAGYPQELAYSQVLYPTEEEEKKISIFLAEKCSIRDLQKNSWPAVETALENWMKGKVPSSTTTFSRVTSSNRPLNALSQVQSKQLHQQKADQDLLHKWEEAEKQYRADYSRLARLESVIRAREEEILKLEEKLKNREKARLLSAADSEGNMKKLEGIVKTSRERILNLVNEWEQHRKPLINEIRDLIVKRNEQRNLISKLSESLSEDRFELNTILTRLTESEFDVDDETSKKLLATNVEKGSDLRASVVARVLDSVKQVKKQTVEIQRVVEEVKELQKEVSMASETLGAIETDIDDLIFSTTSQHPAGIAAYEFFVEMSERFDELLRLEHQTHLTDLDVRAKAARSHSIAARVSTLKIEPILLDLAKIKAENQLLLSKKS